MSAVLGGIDSCRTLENDKWRAVARFSKNKNSERLALTALVARFLFLLLPFLGTLDHRVYKLFLLLRWALELSDILQNKISVNFRHPFCQLTLAFLCCGIVYDHLYGCTSASYTTHLP